MNEDIPYEHRGETLLELGFGVVVLAAVIGSAAFFFYLIPGHPEVCTGLSVAAWIGIYFVVETRSSNRKLRHDEEIRAAYQRGRLHMQRQLNGEEA